MKAKDIRELSEAELVKAIRESREKILDLNLRKNSGQVDQPHTIKATRRDIARMETILKQKKAAVAA